VKRKLMIVIGMTLMVMLVYVNVFAQGNQQQLQNRFQHEFELTEQVINQARNAIAESKTEKGQALLSLAIQLQNQARTMGQNQQYVQGAAATLKAREQARSAIMVNRQAEENENLVQRQLERTDNLIDQLQNRMRADAPQMARTLFDTARENQRKAWEFYRNRALRPALKLSRQAEKSVSGLLERFKAQQGDLSRIRNQFRQLEQRMDQVRTMVKDCGTDEAFEFLRKAENAFNEALQHNAKGEVNQAENQLRLTRRMLTQAAALCGDQDALQRMIRQMEQEMERVAEAVQNSGDAQALQFMRSARNHLQKAERLCAGGNSEECAANIKAAQMNLQKAKRLVGI